MAARLEIPLSINPRELIRGLRVSEDAVQGLGRSLDGVADEGEKIERAFGDIGRTARSDLGQAEAAADGLERELSLVEDEAGQSAKEFGAAFRGDPVEALEEVQAYIAEITAKWLPGFAGAILTIAGGAVFGVLLTQVEKWREKQAEVNRVADDLLALHREETGQLDAIENQYGDVIKAQLLRNFYEGLGVDETTELFDALGRAGISQQQLNDLIVGGQLRGVQDVLAIVRQTNVPVQDQYNVAKSIYDTVKGTAAAYSAVSGVINNEVGWALDAMRAKIKSMPPLVVRAQLGNIAGVTGQGGLTID